MSEVLRCLVWCHGDWDGVREVRPRQENLVLLKKKHLIDDLMSITLVL